MSKGEKGRRDTQRGEREGEKLKERDTREIPRGKG